MPPFLAGIPGFAFSRALLSCSTRVAWNVGLVLLCLVLLLPVLVIYGSVLVPTGDGIWAHLLDTVLYSYVGNSLLLVTGVGILSLIIGVSTAWLVTMTRFPGVWFLQWALLLPLAIPGYIIAYTYAGMLDVSGPLQAGLRAIMGWQYGDYWFPQIRSPGGAIVMLSLVLYPYIYLLARAAFIEQSVCVLEVARTLGCNAYQAFYRVALPLARPAIIAGLSLVLMETLADYGTVQYFGVSTLTTGIFRTWFGLNSSIAAAQLSAVLMTFVLFLLVIETWSRRRARYFHTSNRYSRIRRVDIPGWKGILVLLFCFTPVMFGFVVPVLQLLLWARQTWADNIGEEFFLYAGNSLQLAVISALLAICLAVIVSYSKRLRPNRLARMAVRLLGIGYAIPGTVIAIGVLVPFIWVDNTLDAWTRQYLDNGTGLMLSGSIVILIFAYLVRFLAVSLNSVEAGLAKIRPSMDEAGRSMRLGPARILRRVHLPMMKGSLLTAVLLVFVDVLKELPATLILRPFNFNTLAIRTYELANEERLADAACPALVIVLAGVLPVVYLSNSLSRSRTGHDQRT